MFQGKIISLMSLLNPLCIEALRSLSTGEDYTDLETIGIDEIALKKGYNDYVTISSVKDNNDALSVVAVLPNRLKKMIKTFPCSSYDNC